MKKFGLNLFSKSWDIGDIEFPVVVVVGVQSHFHVESNLGYVRLSWGWVGVLTITPTYQKEQYYKLRDKS